MISLPKFILFAVLGVSLSLMHSNIAVSMKNGSTEDVEEMKLNFLERGSSLPLSAWKQGTFRYPILDHFIFLNKTFFSQLAVSPNSLPHVVECFKNAIEKFAIQTSFHCSYFSRLCYSTSLY